MCVQRDCALMSLEMHYTHRLRVDATLRLNGLQRSAKNAGHILAELLYICKEQVA
jgi:hypothetical protein